MKFKIIELKGVGPQAAKALEKNGLYYAEQLYNADAEIVSKQTGLAKKDVQRWIDYTHLMKIRTLGPAYANILHREDVGISTVQDLAKCKAEEVLTKMTASNKRRPRVKVLPTLKKVENWIQTAKTTK
jgi:predicted flap endonuclease-1-like 5' DNA nuclease